MAAVADSKQPFASTACRFLSRQTGGGAGFSDVLCLLVLNQKQPTPVHQGLLISIEAAAAFKVYHHSTVPWQVPRGKCLPRPQPKPSMTHSLPYPVSSTRLARPTHSTAMPVRMWKIGWTISIGSLPSMTGTIAVS